MGFRYPFITSTEFSETRYTRAEKHVLGLVHATRRLKPYFLTYPVSLRTNQLVRQILSRPEASGRLTKWAIELGEYDITYESRTAIKAQALADFLAKLTFPVSQNVILAETEPQKWILYVDGSSTNDGSGADLLLKDPHGKTCSYALRSDFAASNNESEYEAHIAGLQLVRKLGANQISVYSDSQLVVCQISQSKNRRADALSKLASTAFSTPNKSIHMEVLSEPGYLEEKAEAKKIQRKTARYALRCGNLYKRSYFDPWLRCVTVEEGETSSGRFMKDYAGRMSAIIRLITWLFLADHSARRPGIGSELSLMSAPRTRTSLVNQLHDSYHLAMAFRQWGTNIIRPFPRAISGYTYVVVAMEYFTKWVELETLRSITSQAIQKFFWKHIVCRFGLLRIVISDNGK
nr:uncharacterized protein LOC113736576 [Coffea arabica]